MTAGEGAALAKLEPFVGWLSVLVLSVSVLLAPRLGTAGTLPFTGACCLLDGSCLNSVTQAQCTGQTGVYQGNGTVCQGAVCPPPPGACCLPTGLCDSQSNQTDCEAAGGAYKGDGTDCAQVDCPIPCENSAPLCDGQCPPDMICTVVEGARRTAEGSTVNDGGAFLGECVCKPLPPCESTAAPECNGTCPPGQSCVPPPFGAQAILAGSDGAPREGSGAQNSQECKCATDTPTATPTDTPTATATPTDTPTATPTVTATPTNTPRDNGAPCTDPMDCISGNCVDDVCCDTVCDEPDQICNLAGSVDTCTDLAAPAPTTSRTGLLIGLGILAAIAAVALWRRRELKHYLWSV